MADQGMFACQPRLFRVTTDTDTQAAKSILGLMQRDFIATAPGEKLDSDIPY